MLEITPRFDRVLMIIQGIKNNPGIGARFTLPFKEAGVNIDYFQVVVPPKSEYADIVGVGIRKEEIAKDNVVKAVKNISKSVGGKGITILTGIVEISIKIPGMYETPGIINQIFSVCEKLNINVIAAHTTFTSMIICIEKKKFTTQLLEELQKEFE